MNQRPFSMLDLLMDAKPLSQVVFVHDYVQFVFQNTYFNLYNPVTVGLGDRTLSRNDLGFCDELCRLIGHRVVDTSTEVGRVASVEFENGTRVSVSLRTEDATGPEAFELGDNKGTCVVQQND